MDKYEELKEQILLEVEWAVDSINEKCEACLPNDIDLMKFVGSYSDITGYERGMLFAYLSIKSKIEMLEKIKMLEEGA